MVQADIVHRPRGDMRAASILILLTGLAVASAARASTLRVAINHSVRLPVTGPASSVVLGSPSVVDVSVVDSRTVFVSGKTPGSTDVTVIDPLGRTVFRGDIVVGEGATVRVFRGSALTSVGCAQLCASSEGAPSPVASPAAPMAALTSASASSLKGAAASGLASVGQNLPSVGTGLPLSK